MKLHIRRKQIITFYVICCAISWPFMILMQFFNSSWHAIPLPNPIKTTLYMWGPGLAALFCWKHYSEIKHAQLDRYHAFTGGVILNIIIYMVPLLMFVAIYINQLEVNQIILILTLFSTVGFFNLLGEELGWRGFLQPNLNFMSKTQRFLLLGLMWEVWHLPMRLGALYNGAEPIFIAMISAGTFLLTFIIGFYIDHTKSVTTAIGLHSLANFLFQLSSLTKIPQQNLIPYFILVALFYSTIFMAWNKIKTNKNVYETKTKWHQS